MPPNDLPKYDDLLWPTLEALERLGGSASIHEISDHIAISLGLTDELTDVLHNQGPQTEVDYRAAWARTNLRLIDAVDNPSRGVWTVTERGRQLGSEAEVRELVREQRKQSNSLRRSRPSKGESGSREDGDEAGGKSPWEDELLEILRQMNPDAFERLSQRLLRESGFTKVEVTGRSGDGGIDGRGVLRINLISFHVQYQCKRYAGAVGASAIRDFRGAMVGRADKGLFITTGRFTKDAEREAVRDGAPPIDLIDGLELCALLRDRGLGVTMQTVEVVRPHAEFFESI